MCGIAGILNLKENPCPEKQLTALGEALTHRGPDDSGVFLEGPLGLVFRRLSILDLERGHQPMSSRDRRWTIVFNGEIYNHLELRKELGPEIHFDTHSDTETLLAGFIRHGTDFFRRLNGMFSCAIWDKKERVLTLARDPLGIKPLYFHNNGESFYFCSELRPLLGAGIPTRVHPQALLDYLAYGYVHAPATIIEGIEKFPAGHWMQIKNSRVQNPASFWSLPQESSRKVDPVEAERELEDLLQKSVRDQCLSDVPIGVFLSGGIDSSVVTAFMARESSKPVRSYSIGFDGDSVDESGYAETVAKFLKTEHQTLRLPANLLDQIPRMVECLDEPIADAAILPTWHLSTEARKNVKVVLTGEGGDEVFAGYGRHKAAYATEAVEKFPSWMRPLAAWGARKTGSGAYFRSIPLGGPQSWARAETGARFKAALDLLDLPQAPANWPWMSPFLNLKGLNGLLSFDLQTSMRDQLLMKVDKTTMRASLEARVPLLDLRLVDYGFRLPTPLKIKFFRGKYLLRRVASRMLPRKIVVRKKHGFILRTASWMRSTQNQFLDEAIKNPLLLETGLFRKETLENGVRLLRQNSPQTDVDVYFRLLLFSLWLKNLKVL